MTFSVQLLGTGNPYPNLQRRGPAALISAGEHRLLVDCGEGVLGQLMRAGVDPAGVSSLLVTHFHSDHVTGMPEFAFSSWTAGRQSLNLVGPTGIQRMWDLYMEMFAHDVTYRVGQGWPKAAMTPAISQIDGDCWTHEVVPGLVVTARRVSHVGPDCIGYRFDYEGQSIVISGDTTYCQAMVDLAEDVDVLVNNCSVSKPAPHTSTTAEGVDWKSLREDLLTHVSSPEIVAQIANESGARHVVLTHMQPGTDPDFVRSGVQATYAGQVTVGEDLLTVVPASTARSIS